MPSASSCGADTIDMFRQATEFVPLPIRDRARGLSRALQAAYRWCRSDSTRHALGQGTCDLFESCGRVARRTHRPTRDGVLQFLGNQVLVNAVAWTAGVAAAGLVGSFFEAKGLRNLWGLTASGGRTVVSADDYQLIVTFASYSAGLVMLILMRHLILRVVAEFRSLRAERARDEGACHFAPSDCGDSLSVGTRASGHVRSE